MTSFFVLLWALYSQPGGLFEGYDVRSTPLGPIYYRGWALSSVSWVETFLPRGLARVESKLGRRLGSEFRVVLVMSYSELSRLCQALGVSPPAEFTQGLALPSFRLFIVRGDTGPPRRPADTAAVTLMHELAHLVLHRRSGTSPPRWLDEGVAMWASQGNASLPDEAYLSLLARARGLYSTGSLETRFPPFHTATSLAYQQSCLMILFVAERVGDQGVRELLDWLEAGGDVWSWTGERMGLERVDFEEEFRRWVAGRRSLGVALISLWNLWTAIALLAVVAIVRHRRKRRLAWKRLEEIDDAGAASDEIAQPT